MVVAPSASPALWLGLPPSRRSPWERPLCGTAEEAANQDKPHAAAVAAAAVGAAASGQTRGRSTLAAVGSLCPGSMHLRKHLAFSDDKVEEEYSAAVAQQAKADDAGFACTRTLLWLLIVLKVRANGLSALAVPLACANLLPSVAQLLLALHAPPTRLYSTLMVLGMAASDLWGKRILWSALMARTVPPAAVPLLLAIVHPLVGASFVALMTLRYPCAFPLRLANNAAYLLAHLFMCNSMGPRLVPTAQPDDSPLAACVSLAAAAACIAASCCPLWTAYWREVQRRLDYAAARGLQVSAQRLDAYEPLSFIVPALAAAIQVWSHWG